MIFYATFGVQYSEDPHPTLPAEYVNPNGVMKVIAPDMSTARALVSAATGNAYAFLYPWPDVATEEEAKMKRYYPDGVNATLSLTLE